MDANDKQYSPQQLARMKATFYATKPTAFTRFVRTFLPWQLWRFMSINLRMLMLIRRSHQTHLRQGPKPAEARSAKAA